MDFEHPSPEEIKKELQEAWATRRKVFEDNIEHNVTPKGREQLNAFFEKLQVPLIMMALEVGALMVHRQTGDFEGFMKCMAELSLVTHIFNEDLRQLAAIFGTGEYNPDEDDEVTNKKLQKRLDDARMKERMKFTGEMN